MGEPYMDSADKPSFLSIPQFSESVIYMKNVATICSFCTEKGVLRLSKTDSLHEQAT